MKGIQFILMTGVAFISLYFFIQLKKRILDFLLLGIMIICAIVFILWPDLTNIIAHKLGVGRGVDLLFYIAILIFWFVVLKLKTPKKKPSYKAGLFFSFNSNT